MKDTKKDQPKFEVTDLYIYTVDTPQGESVLGEAVQTATGVAINVPMIYSNIASESRIADFDKKAQFIANGSKYKVRKLVCPVGEVLKIFEPEVIQKLNGADLAKP